MWMKGDHLGQEGEGGSQDTGGTNHLQLKRTWLSRSASFLATHPTPYADPWLHKPPTPVSQARPHTLSPVHTRHPVSCLWLLEGPSHLSIPRLPGSIPDFLT